MKIRSVGVLTFAENLYLTYIWRVLYISQQEKDRDSSVGIAIRYGLDGPGIESLPIPVAERSQARVYGRSLAGVPGWNPAVDIGVGVVRRK
jgi:hypothetical protein